jgi:hypothetical protein
MLPLGLPAPGPTIAGLMSPRELARPIAITPPASLVVADVRRDLQSTVSIHLEEPALDEVLTLEL